MRILGVTGGCGTGKSTVCRILEEHGGIVLDADQIARELQSVGGPAYPGYRGSLWLRYFAEGQKSGSEEAGGNGLPESGPAAETESSGT